MKKYQQQSIPAEPAATSHQSRIPQISCRRREPPSKNQQRMIQLNNGAVGIGLQPTPRGS